MNKIAVLLMDYGAPTSDAEVRPFISRLQELVHNSVDSAGWSADT